MLKISKRVSIAEDEIKFRTIRSSGPGGQHANKAATAVQLQFDLKNSALPDDVKERLSQLRDKRISSTGIITITARRYRSQEKNRQDAMERLRAIVQKAMYKQKKRISTKLSKSSKEKRLGEKIQRGKLKKMRGKVDPLD